MMSSVELSNFSFVVDGRVAGSALPTGQSNDVADCLARHGFRTVVTLTEAPLPAAAALRERGIRVLHLPIRDFRRPTLEQLNEFAALVADESACPVLVHCKAGLGRTGTMLAVALALNAGAGGTSASSDVIMWRLRRMRRGSIETTEQEEAFQQWYQLHTAHARAAETQPVAVAVVDTSS